MFSYRHRRQAWPPPAGPPPPLPHSNLARIGALGKTTGGGAASGLAIGTAIGPASGIPLRPPLGAVGAPPGLERAIGYGTW